MDITPRQFNSLLTELKKIRGHLEELRNAINEHKTTTENAAHAHQQEQLPAPQIHAKLSLPKAVEDAIAKQPDKPNGWQKANVLTSGATAFFTLLAFIAAFWYACEAHRQTPKIEESAEAARSAANTASEQAKLTRQQLIATTAAVVDVQPSFDGALAVGENKMRMTFSNETHLIASYVCAEYQIIKQIPGGKSIGQQQRDINIPELAPRDPNVGGFWNPDEDRVAISDGELKQFEDTDLNFEVKGSLHYWNGFDTTKKDFCYVYYGYRFKTKSGKPCYEGGHDFLRCDSLPPILRSARKDRATCRARE